LAERRGDHLARSSQAVVALAICVVGALLIGTAVLATRTPVVSVAAVETTMVAVKPVAETVAPTRTGSVVSATWVASTSQHTGIGRVAVEAYARASLRLAREDPGCRLGWTTLAGIGGIESGHGTNGGAYLLADGTTSRPILGPALDGTVGMASIRSDEQSTRWHGDPEWDHAVGPMQFIPSTWRRWGADANGDGDADPNNIVDAAYTAGLYLCASGGDLTTGAGWTRAIFSYNHSDDYVRSVLARANRYVALSGS
jgi:membrane-bound lytic murein transglycosylase B